MINSIIRLGVNIDHVATLRQARNTKYPDPIEAALIAVESGADSITLHLREDRRHIQDDDVRRLKEQENIIMNLEMAITKSMLSFAEDIKPKYCCLVPEKREELTTEGGLDVNGKLNDVKLACKRLSEAGILVSLFIDPEEKQIEAAKKAQAPIIELHTGNYADADNRKERQKELKRIIDAANYAHDLGLSVNAGHGLTYDNVQPISAIPEIKELNIGHSIVSRSIFIGFAQAVKEMKDLMLTARI